MWFVLFLLIYLFPCLVLFQGKCTRPYAVVCLNVLGGWTGLGWLEALRLARGFRVEDSLLSYFSSNVVRPEANASPIEKSILQPNLGKRPAWQEMQQHLFRQAETSRKRFTEFEVLLASIFSVTELTSQRFMAGYRIGHSHLNANLQDGVALLREAASAEYSDLDLDQQMPESIDRGEFFRNLSERMLLDEANRRTLEKLLNQNENIITHLLKYYSTVARIQHSPDQENGSVKAVLSDLNEYIDRAERFREALKVQ